MFANSLNLIADCDLSFVHVFPFSPRPGTPAARMPQLNGTEIKARAARLRAAAQQNLANWLARQHGKTMSVLVEKPGEGRAENFARVQIDPAYESGALVDVTVRGDNGLMLLGDAL
jgi:threonylcarbamoyladenosine tRNA methylthiotransferase MtaB